MESYVSQEWARDAERQAAWRAVNAGPGLEELLQAPKQDPKTYQAEQEIAEQRHKLEGPRQREPVPQKSGLLGQGRRRAEH